MAEQKKPTRPMVKNDEMPLSHSSQVPSKQLFSLGVSGLHSRDNTCCLECFETIHAITKTQSLLSKSKTRLDQRTCDLRVIMSRRTPFCFWIPQTFGPAILMCKQVLL
ncbi:hypothetical protein EAE99_007728 [Botrytis elliptica]|nr:hypothetical protein EAE99_007728 [Botrytis elliptica]